MSITRLWAGFGQEMWANVIVASPLVPIHARFLMLRVLGFDARRCTIESGVRWYGSARVTLGQGAYINRGCLIDHTAVVSIGDDVALGPGVTLITQTHEVGPARRRSGTLVSSPIIIGNGAWLGANVTVLPGVTIGAGAIIGAGAVVRSDVLPNALAVGTPAVAIRELPS